MTTTDQPLYIKQLAEQIERIPLTQIIGVSGKKYNGKDTVGDYLVAHHGYTKLTFAEPIKDICKIVFGITDEQLNTHLKEECDTRWNVTPRKLMQFIGTDLFRDNMQKIMPEIAEDIWLKVLENKIKEHQKINSSSKFVITDVRFENEYALVKKMGGLVIKITRPEFANLDTHLSETLVDTLAFDFELINRG